jgi:hypothetical protein
MTVQLDLYDEKAVTKTIIDNAGKVQMVKRFWIGHSFGPS